MRRNRESDTPFRLTRMGWPLDEAVQALVALSRRSGLAASRAASRPTELSGAESLEGALNRIAGSLGVELDAVELPYAAAVAALVRCGPALIRVDSEAEPCLLAVLRGSRRRLTVVTRDGHRRSLDAQAVAAALQAPIERRQVPDLEALLSELAVAPRRGARLRRAMLSRWVHDERISGVWLLRLSPGAAFSKQAVRGGLLRHLTGFVGAYAAGYALLLGSWWVLGRGALGGVPSTAWLAVWGLVLWTLIPFRLLSVWSRTRLAVGFGTLLRRRLLRGALRLEVDEVRGQGAGELLGRAFDAEALESYFLHGGFISVVATVELSLSAVVLSQGSGGWWHALLLVAWIGVAVAIGWVHVLRNRRWMALRLRLTHDQVENLVGHRTRLAQQPPEQRHERQDALLEPFVELGRRMDSAKALLAGVVPRGWLLVGLLPLVPSLLSGASVSRLAVAVGGLIIAYRGLLKLAEGTAHLSVAAVSWRQVRPVFRAASRKTVGPSVVSELPPASRDQGEPILEGLGLRYRHPTRRQATLHGCGFTLLAGDRVVLEGGSGSGKSTLAALLSGLHEPADGVLLLHGLDLGSWGARAWRRRVALAPQFHENHLVSDSLAFNLLLGRDWPPSAQDLQEAEELCRRLGLGDLLDRMPSGLHQLIGETGWHLSHGERTRVFLARALLQRPDVLVLDESLAGLDAEALERVQTYLAKSTCSLLLIAHPPSADVES